MAQVLRSAIGQPSRRNTGLSPVPTAAPLYLLSLLLLLPGCTSMRITDSPRTATEQFLVAQATARSIEQLSADTLRGRKVFVESAYLGSTTQPSSSQAFILGELRSKLLLTGVQLTDRRDQAQIILEVRSAAVGIDRAENLVGLPGLAGIIQLPELAVVKNVRQKGFASVAFIAYWADTGEVVASSGPAVGRTFRDDWWFIGWGPRTVGDVIPAEPQK